MVVSVDRRYDRWRTDGGRKGEVRVLKLLDEVELGAANAGIRRQRHP
jgi:hypothetical protein